MVRHWFTADTHFGHANIIEYCKRPFKSLEHMDRELIRRWNERVKPEDIVLHLGDFAFKRSAANPKTYLDKLNGLKIIIKGNHDGNNEVRSILTSAVIRYGGIDFWLSHEPKAIYKHNLCGHVHEKWKVSRRGPHVIVNVGVDVWQGRPVSMEEIREAIAQFESGTLQDFTWK